MFQYQLDSFRKMDDGTSYDKIKEHDDALEKLFHLYYKALCTYTMQFTKSMPVAEDIVQNIFVKLADNRETLNKADFKKAYLYRSAYNAYIDTFREDRKKEILMETLKYEALSEQLEEDIFLQQQRIKKVMDLVETLPGRCKEILLLSKQKGYKNKEIAEHLNISIKTVESQIRIAFQKIRKGFKKGNFLIF